jgi:hypothetical protein
MALGREELAIVSVGGGEGGVTVTAALADLVESAALAAVTIPTVLAVTLGA